MECEGPGGREGAMRCVSTPDELSRRLALPSGLANKCAGVPRGLKETGRDGDIGTPHTSTSLKCCARSSSVMMSVLSICGKGEQRGKGLARIAAKLDGNTSSCTLPPIDSLETAGPSKAAF